MTGLFSTINSATAGLGVVQGNLKLVSENISKADDPSRTRHQLQTQTDPSGSVVGMKFDRRMDEALNAKLGQAISDQGHAATRDTYLRRVGDLLGLTTGESTLTAAIKDFRGAWQGLSTTPESAVAARLVVDTGNNLARQVQDAAREVEDLERTIRDDIGSTVDDINTKLLRIQELNRNIVAGTGKPTAGDAVNTLRDQRDQTVRELNELLGVRTLERPDGNIVVFTSSGLSLVDASAVQLNWDGRDIGIEGRPTALAKGHITTGKLGALVDLVADGSRETPPKAASSDVNKEVIRKLRSQLDTVVAAFTGGTTAGQPTSFRDAYNGATPVEDEELRNGFFTGDDRFDFAINTELLDGSLEIKASAIAPVADAIDAGGRSFTADGLAISDASYTDLVTGMMGGWSRAGDDAEADFEAEQETRDLLEQRFYNKVGINLDEEIAYLQSLQTSYTATARVYQVANTLFNTLEGIVG